MRPSCRTVRTYGYSNQFRPDMVFSKLVLMFISQKLSMNSRFQCHWQRGWSKNTKKVWSNVFPSSRFRPKPILLHRGTCFTSIKIWAYNTVGSSFQWLYGFAGMLPKKLSMFGNKDLNVHQLSFQVFGGRNCGLLDACGKWHVDDVGEVPSTHESLKKKFKLQLLNQMIALRYHAMAVLASDFFIIHGGKKIAKRSMITS